MDAKSRALAGALGGAGGTIVLSALRGVFKKTGLVFDTAPTQVVDRVEELVAPEGFPPNARWVLTWIAHAGYGVGTGAVFGLLRRESGGTGEEAAVGSSLGILAWGVGWSSWLPLAGVHRAPWTQRTPKVLLPVLDHAVYGAAWGLIYSALNQSRK